jgi:phage gp29-like protein
VSEWNPKDADAASTRYDLTDWTVDERADVVAALAQAEVPEAWVGDELVVPQEQEEVVEDILDELEEQMDADDAEETADDNITEYELDEWTEGERKQLCDMLDNLDIGYRWDGTVLLVPIGVEAVVDSCLDSIDSRGVEFTEGK